MEALHTRARAYKECEKYSEAIADLNEALKISPQNREVHKFIIKVKEELKEKSNNNEDDNKRGPVGAVESDRFKFVDADASSVATDN